MRTKGFILFIVIFTIFYIVFFIMFDKLSTAKAIKQARKHAESLINMEQYAKFANFYGIQATAALEVILRVYDDFNKGKDCIISEVSKVYNLNSLEFVVVILYLEYLNLMSKKLISLEGDSMTRTTFVEQNMLQKYNTYFQEKQDLNTIVGSMGKNALTELSTMDKGFLMPGVRLINSKLYYVGDYL